MLIGHRLRCCNIDAPPLSAGRRCCRSETLAVPFVRIWDHPLGPLYASCSRQSRTLPSPLTSLAGCTGSALHCCQTLSLRWVRPSLGTPSAPPRLPLSQTPPGGSIHGGGAITGLRGLLGNFRLLCDLCSVPVGACVRCPVRAQVRVSPALPGSRSNASMLLLAILFLPQPMATEVPRRFVPLGIGRVVSGVAAKLEERGRAKRRTEDWEIPAAELLTNDDAVADIAAACDGALSGSDCFAAFHASCGTKKEHRLHCSPAGLGPHLDRPYMLCAVHSRAVNIPIYARAGVAISPPVSEFMRHGSASERATSLHAAPADGRSLAWYTALDSMHRAAGVALRGAGGVGAAALGTGDAAGAAVRADVAPPPAPPPAGPTEAAPPPARPTESGVRGRAADMADDSKTAGTVSPCAASQPQAKALPSPQVPAELGPAQTSPRVPVKKQSSLVSLFKPPLLQEGGSRGPGSPASSPSAGKRSRAEAAAATTVGCSDAGTAAARAPEPVLAPRLQSLPPPPPLLPLPRPLAPKFLPEEVQDELLGALPPGLWGDADCAALEPALTAAILAVQVRAGEGGGRCFRGGRPWSNHLCGVQVDMGEGLCDATDFNPFVRLLLQDAWSDGRLLSSTAPSSRAAAATAVLPTTSQLARAVAECLGSAETRALLCMGSLTADDLVDVAAKALEGALVGR